MNPSQGVTHYNGTDWETPSPFVTTTQAAHILDVSPSTITRWVREGYIAAGRSLSPTGHGRIRIPVEEIERVRALLAPQTATSA